MTEQTDQQKRAYLQWAYREAVRTDFLETRQEIFRYMAALYEAALWGDTK